MTLDARGYSRKPPNKKRINVFFIIIGLLAIPSSLAGINEFTSFLPEKSEPYVCHTGIREGWYKNCEYGFQFEIPTEYWLIYDKNTGRFNEDPYYDLDVAEYWIVIEHKVDYSGVKAASILFQIHDLTEHPWGTTLDEVLEYDKNKTSNDPYFYNVTYNRVNDEYWYVDFVGDISNEYDFHCSSYVKLIDTKMHTRQICIGAWIFEREDWPVLFDDLDKFEDSFRYIEN